MKELFQEGRKPLPENLIIMFKNRLTWISSFNSCVTAGGRLLELLFEVPFTMFMADGKFLVR